MYQISIFALVITLFAYQVGVLIQRKFKHPVFNPILIAVALVIIILVLIGYPVNQYSADWQRFSWLLTPATVCLAIPLYEQLQILKTNLIAICAGIVSGALASLGCVFIMSKCFAIEEVLLFSLLPKSITTAMGVEVSNQIGGIAAITTVAIIATGIIGSCIGGFFCKIFKIQDEISTGVAMGTASHVVGTAKAYETSELTGAVSSLSLIIAGVVTSIICAAL